MEILFGIPIPPSEAVAVAQACLPSGPLGGLLHTALMPAACIDGLQKYQAALPGPAVLSHLQLAHIQAGQAKRLRETQRQGPCTRCGGEKNGPQWYTEVGTGKAICKSCYNADRYKERTKKPKLETSERP